MHTIFKDNLEGIAWWDSYDWLQFKCGDRVEHADPFLGKGTVDGIGEDPNGDPIYLISLDGHPNGQAILVEEAHEKYRLIKCEE